MNEILDLVAEFLKLNELRRTRSLDRQEVENWYELKRNIERDLFSNPPSKVDRRQSLRLRNLRLPVSYDSGIGSMDGVMREASEGGLFLATPTPLPVGTEIQVTVTMQDAEGMPQEEIQFPARVIYNNVGHSFSDRAFSGMGLLITEGIAFPEKQKWFRFLDRLLENLVSKGMSGWNK